MAALLRKIIGDKRQWRGQMARVAALPEDYRFVFKKIQEYMFGFGAGTGMDLVDIQYELIDLFEAGAAEGKHVLEITGEDVAAFSDELLRTARTYLADRRVKLNREITEELGKGGGAR